MIIHNVIKKMYLIHYILVIYISYKKDVQMYIEVFILSRHMSRYKNSDCVAVPMIYRGTHINHVSYSSRVVPQRHQQYQMIILTDVINCNTEWLDMCWILRGVGLLPTYTGVKPVPLDRGVRLNTIIGLATECL